MVAEPVGVTGEADGRTARRDRNRLAVLDAVLELFSEGDLVPSPDDVARRSGVSSPRGRDAVDLELQHRLAEHAGPHVSNHAATAAEVLRDEGDERYATFALGKWHLCQMGTIFGQGRSNYVPFLGAGVPSVFFTDATGPCYHSAQDEIDVVDFAKLSHQIAIALALALTRDLADTEEPRRSSPTPHSRPTTTPSCSVTSPRGCGTTATCSRPRPRPPSRRGGRPSSRSCSRVGTRLDEAILTLLGGAAAVVSILTHGDCDGFLVPDS